jgi:hypothetical protein
MSSINCSNCGIKNKNSYNFCIKCGFKLNIIRTCDVCRDVKMLLPLKCGHSFCKECLDGVYSSSPRPYCPTCRKEFKRCNNCFNYRYDGYKCLDCHTKKKAYMCNNCNYVYTSLSESDILNETLDECVNCKEFLVGIVPIDREYIDNVMIKSKEDVNPEFIDVCTYCLSECIQLSRISNLYKCSNCDHINTRTLSIPKQLHNYIPFISKDTINPKKIEICEHCFSDKIIKSNEKYCSNCGKNNIKGLLFLERFKDFLPKVSKEIANPSIIKICNTCYNHNFKLKIINDKEIMLCTNCNSNFNSSISIFEHNRDMYPIKKDIIYNSKYYV